MRLYREVVHLAPTSGLAPESLFRGGRLKQEMARLFRDEKWAAAARKDYKFLLKEYPQNRFTSRVKKALAELEAAVPAPAAREEVARERAKPVQLSNLRQWSTPNYTRVVVDLEDEVKYEAGRISNPDRIFFDLHNTHLTAPLAGRNFPVNDGMLKRIRLAQNREGITRVVLEVGAIGTYSAFLLPNPYRLVIDIQGAGKPASPKPETAARKESPPKGRPAPAETAPAETAAKREPAEEAPAAAAVPPQGASGSTAEPASPAPAIVSSTSGPTSKPVYESVKPALPARDGHRSLTRVLGLKIGRIVIDAGHGGHDTGTIGPTGYMEKDLVLDVAKRLGALLEDRLGSEVIYTREDDVFVPLETRTGIANQKQADLFVSVHANSSRDHQARGVETYYLSFTTARDALEVAARENAVSEKSIHELQDLVKKITLHEKVDESREFAAEVQRSLYGGIARGNTGLRNRGVKKAPFIVLIGANMPSVLAEVSFVSNPQDERLLKKPEYRQRIAESLFRGIQRYTTSLGGVKVASRAPGHPPAN